MYERSAIVLERFYTRLLGLNKVNNLKKNFDNYSELFEKFSIVQKSNSDEFAVLGDFQVAESQLEQIQANEEKLYNKNAKLEYNRDLIFQDISQEPEEIEKCLLKLEGDIEKNQEKLVSLRKDLIETLLDYNGKKSSLSECKETRKVAEEEYNAILAIAKQNLENIPLEFIEVAKNLIKTEKIDEVINVLLDNGKAEKIPFNNQVITSAAQMGYDIYCRESECYLEAYRQCKKLINELLEGAVSVELHERTIRSISVKLNYLQAEKEYLVAFLDYERIAVMYGKRMHRSLMVDACEKLEKDKEQIENLYKLLLKEITGKSTKKAYKELYNKSYLMEIEDKDAKFKKEKNKVNLSTGTIMNSNYWRIEGIKNIYTVFYNNVVQIFGRDLDEFEIPVLEDDTDELEEVSGENEKVLVQDSNMKKKLNSIEETSEVSIENVEKEKPQKGYIQKFEDISDEDYVNGFEDLYSKQEYSNKKLLKLSKLNNAKGRKIKRHYTRRVVAYEDEENMMFEPINSEEEYDIFGERYQNVDSNTEEFEDFDILNDEDIEKNSMFDTINDEEMLDINFNKEMSKKKKSKIRNPRIFKALKKLGANTEGNLANE